MRFLMCLILWVIFAPLAQADEWYEYIQVQCDPKQKIFQVRDISVGTEYKDGRSIPATSSIKTPGEIYGKRDGIEWTESDNGDVITVKKDTLDIPKCIIMDHHDEIKFEYNGHSYPHGIKVNTTSPVEFKVIRTSIDQGNVQRQCGAALGAEFTVFVNDEPMGYYPSKKARCFEQQLDSSFVSYSTQGLRRCENSKPIFKTIPGLDKLKTTINVCSEGSATDYLKYLEFLEYIKANPNKQEQLDLVAKIEKEEYNHSYNLLARTAFRAEKELRGERFKNEKLQKSNEKLTEVIDEAKQERKALKADIDALQEELATERSKSLWQRFFRTVPKDK